MNKGDKKKLKYKRQFLLSSVACADLDDWKKERFSDFYLYVHPDAGLFNIRKDVDEVVLIGYMLNPHKPDKTENEILSDIIALKSEAEVSNYLYPIVGRFVLLIRNGHQEYIYHDACGLKTVYYTFQDNAFFAASQPNLLKIMISLKESENYKTYYESKYVQHNKEHYLPSGLSLFDGVQHLVPNHFLNLKKLEQKRFWPNKKISHNSLEFVEKELAVLLRKTMHAANSKFDLALPITAGLDSRIILSACREIKNDIKFYTLKYRNLTEESPDLKIPIKMSTDIGLDYEIKDCYDSQNQDFLNIYRENSDMAHVDDWGYIASGMYQNYDSSLVAIKGNCVEIGRCTYFKSGIYPDNRHLETMLASQYHWDELSFVSNKISEWRKDLLGKELNFGYKDLDLFYWEHRVGSWQAQSQLEWDIVQEAFTPFNNREIIDLMLSVEAKYRIRPDFILFKNVIGILWPELLEYPINPKSFLIRMKILIKKLVLRIGIYRALKKVLRG